jgi:ATP-dependent RNA helicase HrpB
MIPLPIDSFLDDIVEAVRRTRAAVISAAPGAGKTTRVPPALTADGPVILLQPRRIAARTIATRIANERGWIVGREVGWQVRFERRMSAATQLLVVTEGILTARLQSDPLLTSFRTIVIDEFHERSIHADLAIALARQAWRARDDLRLVIMSATLNAEGVSAFVDHCPIVNVPGRPYPVEIEYKPACAIADAATDVCARTGGQVLCFLPGAAEIRRTTADLEQRLSSTGIEIVPLHGSMDADEQDRALAPSDRRRIIVATNIAETSLTVPGVTAVVDSGLHKVARYDAGRGIDSLETERIPADAADQRAGRAGRLGPGIVWRLWDARDRLRPHRDADIHRIDLAAVVLDVIAWGGDPRTLEWFERPRDDVIEAALELLVRLGIIEIKSTSASPATAGHHRQQSSEQSPVVSGFSRIFHGSPRLTPIGEQVRRIPLHPRLARMLVEAGGAREIAQACALLSERHFLQPRTASTSSDLLSAIDDWRNVPAHVQRSARVIEQLIETTSAKSALSETAFRRASFAGYPDRVAQRRSPGSASVRLASGAGAVIAQESGVRDGEFLVAVEVQASTRRDTSNPETQRIQRIQRIQRMPANDARIRIASRVEREWLQPTSSELLHRFDPRTESVKAVRIDYYDALVLAEHRAPVDDEIAAEMLAKAWLERGAGPDDERLLLRTKFTGLSIDVEDLVRSAARGAQSLGNVSIERGLPETIRRTLNRDAPETIVVPSGRAVRLEYQSDGSVSAAVKLQEVFGLAETPRIGPRSEPVLLSLLAPNGRPVQVTRDLRSFWDRTYPEVRKELRGRYPKHPWPEDPWNAPATHRTIARRK